MHRSCIVVDTTLDTRKYRDPASRWSRRFSEKNCTFGSNLKEKEKKSNINIIILKEGNGDFSFLDIRTKWIISRQNTRLKLFIGENF